MKYLTLLALLLATPVLAQEGPDNQQYIIVETNMNTKDCI